MHIAQQVKSTEYKILEQIKNAEVALIKERAQFWAKVRFYAKEGVKESFIKQVDGDLNDPDIRVALDAGHSVVIDGRELGCVVPDFGYAIVYAQDLRSCEFVDWDMFGLTGHRDLSWAREF